MNTHLGDILDDVPNLKFADDAEALAAYLKRVEAIKKANNVATVPLTSRRTEEFFDLAVRQHPPFKEGDRGFKDTVIYLSVIDHLKASPNQTGAFVSADDIFQHAKAGELARAATVSLETYGSLTDLNSQLSDRLDKAIKIAWQKDKEIVTAVLKTGQSEIEKYLSENLELSESEIGGFSRLIAVEGLRVQEIKNVQTPVPIEVKADEPVRISFDVELELRLIVQPFISPKQPLRLKVGEQAPPLGTLTISDLLQPQQQEQLLPWVAEIEAICPPSDKRYSKIEFVSVRSKGLSLRDLMTRPRA